jgi:DHA2 family methylenomycin A resistance protein-like MFS transporter
MHSIDAETADRGRKWRTLIATSFGFALVQLDVSIVNVALPPLSTALGAQTAALQWVVDSYALCLAAFLMSAGYLGDRFGARRVYQTGLAVFALGSAACGLAPNPGILIAARAIQGIGAAAMIPCSLALLNHATAHDHKLRAWAIGWWTAAGAIAMAAGPVVGGFLLEATGWRGIFLVNPPICAVGAMMTLRIAETETDSRRREFDLLGQGLIVCALLALTGAVIEAKPLGLGNGLVPALAAAGLAAFALFILTEQRQRDPMMPPQLFANPIFRVALAYGVVVNLTYYGVLFVLSLYLQQVLGYRPLQAGLAYLPLTATFFAVNILSGWMIGKTGSRLPMGLGALIDALGFFLLFSLDGSGGLPAMLCAFVLLPGGMGLGVPAMTAALLASIDKKLSGVAAGALNAARQAAGAMGVALFGAWVGGDGQQIVAGLHEAAIVSIWLLVFAALMSAQWLRPAAERLETAGAAARP